MSMIFSFHGSDHKNGCTMISQSVAEAIVEYKKDANVMLVFLNGRRSTEFIGGEVISIDDFKNRLDSRMPMDENLLGNCRRNERLYVIGGLRNEMEHRRYFPEDARMLLKEMESRFDIIIADTGSNIDSGLALGALLQGSRNCMILTQNEASIGRYEDRKGIYSKLSLSFDYYLLNKYNVKEPYSLKYITQRLQIPKESLMKVSMGEHGNQAEAEKKTLLEYENDEFSADVVRIASIVARDAGLGEIKTQRNKIWKNFI